MKKIIIAAIFLIALLSACTRVEPRDVNRETVIEPIWVIEPGAYTYATDFKCGIASVGSTDGTTFFINKNGENIFDKAFNETSGTGGRFINGLTFVQDEAGETFYGINITGRELLQWDYVVDNPGEFIFSKPLRAVQFETGKYGVVNYIGQWVIEPVYEYAHIDNYGNVYASTFNRSGFFTEDLQYVELPKGYRMHAVHPAEDNDEGYFLVNYIDNKGDEYYLPI